MGDLGLHIGKQLVIALGVDNLFILFVLHAFALEDAQHLHGQEEQFFVLLILEGVVELGHTALPIGGVVHLEGKAAAQLSVVAMLSFEVVVKVDFTHFLIHESCSWHSLLLLFHRFLLF